jgi:uncharacterized FAD-dependent dehydrogenase
MSEIADIFVPLEALDEALPRLVARSLGRSPERVGEVRVLRRSLDARKGHRLGYQLRVALTRPGESPLPPLAARRSLLLWPSGKAPPRVVIVGSGPAGTWAALRLAEAGVQSTILERGKAVQPRRRDLAMLQRGTLDPESNYCFGEGGAGTYSDGKLYTRSKDRAGVAAVLADLVRFGAPPEVEVDARPHVGSNLLPKVLTGIRLHLESLGVKYVFESEAAGLRGKRGQLQAVLLRGGGEIEADAAVIAVGHSARTAYTWLLDAGIPLERKDIAVGVRIEHPQPVIDRLQYGENAGHPRLPPAFYELKAAAPAREVYSFCMCPGGWIVPATTEPDAVVVNGMSLSRRDSPFANAGLVVSIRAAEFGSSGDGALAGVAFQRRIEQAAFREGGGGFRAPAQRLGDFLAGRASSTLPETSYHRGVVDRRLDDVLPSFVSDALREGLQSLTRRFRGFDHPDAVLIGVETRTSAPVRITRDPATLESPGLAGLYPAGEGAGYAGGIVSAALDGARVAAAILQRP